MKIIALYLLDQFLSLLAAAVVLFWSAGRMGWWAAWAMGCRVFGEPLKKFY